MSSPGHEIQSFFTSYLVPHFSEVWKCGVVWQSKDIVALFPRHEPFVILYLVPHLSEVWNCGKVRQSKDIVVLFPQSWTLCHSLLSSTLLRGVEVWKRSDKVRILSHVSPSHEPFVILYLVLHFPEVWKCGKVWQSKDIVVLFPQSWTLYHSLLSSTLPRGVEVWTSPTK